MTLIEAVNEAINRSYTNKSTARQYRAGVARLAKRIPVEGWCDEALITGYRQLLGENGRSLFGVVWAKVYEVAIREGYPCVKPEDMRFRIKKPFVVADPIEILASSTSYSIVSSLIWNDVKEVDGETAIHGRKLNSDERKALVRLWSYYWDYQDPPPSAPIVGLSAKFPRLAMPEDMVEDIVRDRTNADSLKPEAALCYRFYDVAVRKDYSLAEIEKTLDRMADLTNLHTHARRRGNETMAKAVEALNIGDVLSYQRLLEVALRGERDDGQYSAPVIASPDLKTAIKMSNAKLKARIASLPPPTLAGEQNPE